MGGTSGKDQSNIWETESGVSFADESTQQQRYTWVYSNHLVQIDTNAEGD